MLHCNLNDKPIVLNKCRFIVGQNYHSIGSLLPEQGFKPKFSQLYIYDTDNEIANRRTFFGGENQRSISNSSVLANVIIQDLKLMLDSNDVLVQSYRMVRDCFQENPHVAALIVGDIGDSIDNKDIVVQTSTGSLRRISELHPSYLPLQYPLLFPYGDNGYRVDIPHRDRDQYFSLILSKRLFQQFLVDAYTMIKIERLHFIRSKQQILRCESYENLRNQQNLENKDISNVGQPVILPSSFTGGAHYMMQNNFDAMSLCKWFGYPDFFITFTCNLKWREVKNFHHNTSLHLEDRPDILCRLFKIKLDSFIKNIREYKISSSFKQVCHIVIFVYLCMLTPSGLLLNILIRLFPAEIPNINDDLELYSLVSEFMIHGPCEVENINCPCMVDKQCSKNFPKQFYNHSSVDVNGYPLYMKKTMDILSKNQGSSIKYLFKYINKDPNKATIVVDINTVSHQEKTMILTMFLNNLQLQLLCSHLGWNVIKFVWKLNDRLWKPRKIGRSIERIHSVSPKLGKVYFLRILLNKMKGPKSFEEICTVNGEEFPTFRDACYALGLLDDDKEYVDAIKEASHSGTR
uniref:Helitron helicase-like domain-containing protein n=1 Tax=Lactuca sativa TaxID=4236 RepID=A0A9R1V7Y7_LACSA|nr:hypothetical protein LSAT_V11C600327900 [Lactuca sativa]